MNLTLAANEARRTDYELTPTERGEYHFGKINLFAESFLGLVQRRFQANVEKMVPVYPSVIQMKNMELKAFKQIAHQSGIKKIRRLGHSMSSSKSKITLRVTTFAPSIGRRQVGIMR